MHLLCITVLTITVSFAYVLRHLLHFSTDPSVFRSPMARPNPGMNVLTRTLSGMRLQLPSNGG